MKRRLFLAGLLLTGMLAAASADTRIILVGDSITGLSRNHARGYANQMDEALAACPPDEGPFTIVALGGSGQTVQSWQSVEKRSRGQPFTLDVKTIDVKTELSRPADILIVMLGMNNALAPHIEDTPESIEAWIACYRDLVAALRERCTPKRLVLCSVTPCTEAYDGPKNRLIRNMNAAVLRLCVELGAAYAKTGETVWRVMARGRRIAPDFHGTGDFVHPNAVGHAAIAAAMLDAIGQTDAAAWVRANGIDAPLAAQREKQCGLSWEFGEPVAGPDGAFSLPVTLYWSDETAERPRLRIAAPEGWSVFPEAHTGTAGAFVLTGKPDRERTLFTVSGTLGEETRTAELAVPAPWLAAAHVPLRCWSGLTFQRDRSRTSVDDAIEAGEPLRTARFEGAFLRWTPLFPSVNYTGYDRPGSVDFSAITHAKNFETGYAARRIWSEKERPVTVRIGRSTFAGVAQVDVWLNGQVCYAGALTRTNAPATLRKGWNTLVFKHMHSTWQFQSEIMLEPVPPDTLDDLRYALP